MLTLDPQAQSHLGRLIGARFDQLVWDINAVYIVFPGETIKIGQGCAAVASRRSGRREDVYPLEVTVYPVRMRFAEEGEPGHGYWVVATDETITGIELIRGAVRFPPWEAVRPSLAGGASDDVFVFDCGVFVHTTAGVLPAIPAGPMMYLFDHERCDTRPVVSLVDLPEALAMLPEIYDLVAIDRSP